MIIVRKFVEQVGDFVLVFHFAYNGTMDVLFCIIIIIIIVILFIKR